MKSRLQKIEITNFKAFREFSLNIEGRHLLVYGANGAGKSSLYWALHTFLQSASKQPRGSISKYFEPEGKESLLNIHEQEQGNPRSGEIALTLRDSSTRTDTTYRINKDYHGTHNEPAILKGDLASDFITYRFFFGFSNFKNSERFDLWPLFETEILPFCVLPGAAQTPLRQWRSIRSGVANPWGSRGIGGADAYASFRAATERFAVSLVSVVRDISQKAQEFYQTHFATDDLVPIQLILGVTRAPSFSGTNLQNSQFRKPILELHLKIGETLIKRPQSFLNEAKMTQVALSVRLAASLVNLQEDEQRYFKLLVLDDLLVSLDMSNRMKVVEILLSDTFANYQKIILTHELGFFREFRRRIGPDHPEWDCIRLAGSPATEITCHNEKTDLQKAEEYLHGYCLDEAALCLRKACEDTAKRFIGHNEVIPTKEFLGLADALRAARNRVLAGFPSEFYEKVIRNTPDQHRSLLVASSDADLDTAEGLDPATRGRLKTNRNRLRRLLTNDQVERLRQIRLIDDILACTERVLNPAAHSDTPPLYLKEVEDALALVSQLETSLNP